MDVHRNGHPALQAVVNRIHSAGPNVRLELVAESGERLCAELTQDRYRSLQIRPGSTVYVTPRDVKVFADKPLRAARTGIRHGCRAGTFRRRRGLRTARIGLWRRRSLRATHASGFGGQAGGGVGFFSGFFGTLAALAAVRCEKGGSVND